MKMKTISLFIAAVILFIGISAAADEIRLTNGDILTGEIIVMEGDVLVFKTNYSGEISVNWKNVNCLTSEKAKTFVFEDQSRVVGLAQCLSDGEISIFDGKDRQMETRTCSEFQAINPPPGLRFTGNIVAGGSLASGNTDAKGANAASAIQARTDRHRWTMNARGNYNETNDVVDVQNAAGSLKYDFFLIKKYYTYAQFLVEHDRLQDLRTRITVGPGVGYQFIESINSNLFGEIGISYVDENYYWTDDQDYYTYRWSVGFEREIWPNRVKFFHLHEGYVRVEELDNYYIRSRQGFRLPLAKNFYANIQYDVDYKSQPTAENKHTDTRLLFGVGYDFDF